ncbi:hypothetical protein C6H64_01635 [Photorhabdus luminescens]|nr:hypothetical protein C6H64_01635 [Photorhabdus luminescens]
MKGFGVLILIVGIIAIFTAFNMDVSVSTGYGGRVNNIGLIAQRQNFILISCFVVFCGLIMILFGNRKKDNQENYVNCPFCAEKVNPMAIKCKHCGSEIKEQMELKKEKMELEKLKSFTPSELAPFSFYRWGRDGNEPVEDRIKELAERLIKSNPEKTVNEIESYYRIEIEKLAKRLPKQLRKEFHEKYTYWLYASKSQNS